MKILFLCGSLEPGRDGVGDYTRRLAGELIRQGQHANIISLNENNTSFSFLECKQESEGVSIPVLRLSNNISYKRRFIEAKKMVARLNPEWISLQFVPFSFQKKGLPFALAKRLVKISEGKKWHIMFHELWIGIDAESRPTHKLLGRFQKKIIRNMIRNISPKIISTHSQVYQYKLNNLGFKAELLPLISNIPEFSKSANGNLPLKKQNHLTFTIFGYIQPKATFYKFALRLSEYAEKNDKTIHFNFIGINGNELVAWKSICEKFKFTIADLGEQSIKTISSIIAASDFGISSTPFMQIEKSGTAAAFRSHNIPVICIARPWTPDVEFIFSAPQDILLFNNEDDLDKLLNPPVNRISVASLLAITQSFTKSFHTNS